MSLISRFTKLFSTNESSSFVGVVLRQQSLGVCYSAKTSLEEQNNEALFDFQQLELGSNSYAQLLSKVIKEHQLEGSCNLVLPASMTNIVQVDKPNVPDSEINGALKWQIKDLVNITPDNMVLDYFDGPNAQPVGSNEKINVVCAPLNEVKNLVNVLLDEDIKIKNITIEEFAFTQLIPVKEEACLLVCQQPGEEILLLIVKNGQLFFHRRLRGFSQIAKKSQLELDMGAIDTLSLEIQRSTDYFERQLKQAPIKEIAILVPIENEAYLVQKLSENTNVSISQLPLPESYADKRELACAFGATLVNGRGDKV